MQWIQPMQCALPLIVDLLNCNVAPTVLAFLPRYSSSVEGIDFSETFPVTRCAFVKPDILEFELKAHSKNKDGYVDINWLQTWDIDAFGVTFVKVRETPTLKVEGPFSTKKASKVWTLSLYPLSNGDYGKQQLTGSPPDPTTGWERRVVMNKCITADFWLQHCQIEAGEVYESYWSLRSAVIQVQTLR